MKPIKASLTYEEAYAELLQIASEIEEESVSVDVLATKVKKASELISFCQNKLKATEKDVLNIIQKMENKPTP
jgi:exodeoxyribonuclease VII small subunit